MQIVDIVVSFIENYVMLLFLNVFFQEKKKYIRYIFTLLLFMISVLTNTLKYPLLIVIPFLVLLFYAYINLEGEMAKKVFYSFFVFALLLIINLAGIPFEQIFIKDITTIYKSTHIVFILYLIFSTGIYILIYYFFKTRKSLINSDLFSQKEWLFFNTTFLIIIVTILLCCLMIIHIPTGYAIMLMICLIGLFLSFMYYHELITRAKKAQIQQALNDATINQQKLYYAKLKDIYEKNRSLNHDLKNHFIILSSYILDNDKEQALAYLKDMNASLHGEDLIHTSNEVVNFVINSKLSFITQKRIICTLHIDDVPDFMEDIDINILLGNIFDNAIEAQGNVKEPNIEFSMYQKGDYFIINQSNTYLKESIQWEKEELISTKKDKKNHGLGIQNIKEIVFKYKGTMEITTEERFNILIILTNSYQD